MSRRSLLLPAAIVAVIAGGAIAVAVPQVAFAESGATTTTFVGEPAVSAVFGSDWYLTIAVAAVEPYDSVQPSSGTVDVYVDGIAGAYAAGLPIQADGLVYVAQPTAQPLLGAGEHSLRAIFNPAAGSRSQTSQTTAEKILTITPLDVTATVSASMDASVSEEPLLRASLAGSYVDAAGGAPAGTWSFEVTDAKGNAVFSEQVAQEAGETDALVIPVDAELPRGSEFSVTSSFTVDPSIAQGVTVTQPAPDSFTSASATLGETMVTPVAVAWWAVWAAIAGLLLLTAAAVWLLVLVVRRRRTPPTAAADAPSTPERPLELGDSGLGSLVRDVTARVPAVAPDAPGARESADRPV
ncbi:MAG: hypothetical protein ABWX82_07050 [Leifsonia sp.]